MPSGKRVDLGNPAAVELAPLVAAELDYSLSLKEADRIIGADHDDNQNFAKMSDTPQSRVQAPPGELKLGKTVWSEVSTMATNVAPRKSKHKAASSLKGKTIRAAEFYTLSSGERKLNSGGLVTFNYTTDNTASVKGLGKL